MGMGVIIGKTINKELSSDQVQEISDNTHFHSDEITRLYKSFLKDYPKGHINEKQFISRYSEMYPGGDAKNMAKEVFRCADADGNGLMNFREFMGMVSILSRGTLTEKLHWAFGLFDKDGDGAITMKELVDMLSATFNMRGRYDHRTVEQEAEIIFQALDKDKNSLISREEFMNTQTLNADLK